MKFIHIVNLTKKFIIENLNKIKVVKVIFLGAPGAGKGTYAQRLKDNYNIPHISVGDLLREALEKETATGLQAKEYMEQGLLVPDEIVIELLKERLENEDTNNGFILDGFPRNVMQAQMLKGIADIDKVINFDVSKETVLRRLGGRETCSDCKKIYNKNSIISKEEGICDECGGELIQREDDKEETILKRLDTYKEQTKPLEEFYKNFGVLHTINSNLDINNPECNILDECKGILDKILKKY